LGVGLEPYPVKNKIVEKPPRNSAGLEEDCGGGQGLNWAVEPRGEREREREEYQNVQKELTLAAILQSFGSVNPPGSGKWYKPNKMLE
jgi:hypothetical protein